MITTRLVLRVEEDKRGNVKRHPLKLAATRGDRATQREYEWVETAVYVVADALRCRKAKLQRQAKTKPAHTPLIGDAT